MRAFQNRSLHDLPSPVQGPAAVFGLVAIGLLIAIASPAAEITETLSLDATLAAAGQCQQLQGRLPNQAGALADLDDTCRGGLPIQIKIGFAPTPQDQFGAELGWAAGNGLNPVSPFQLAPWAADLEDDVTDINGRNRDYLLTAWYQRQFKLGKQAQLSATFGLIDSTDYVDGNAYANDEYEQFMNAVFDNSPVFSLPSYDAGAVLALDFGSVSATALGMNVGENDAGNNYNFWSTQLGWHPQFEVGDGNYLLLLNGTSSEFPDPSGRQDEALLSWGLTADQALGKHLGLFLRLSWQEERAAVDNQALYSGGINLAGSAWGRSDDNIGLGYAYLSGGNKEIEHTQAVEAYYRAQLSPYFALTADVQYMSDELQLAEPGAESPKGWVLGLRAVASF
jgi:porin